MDTAPITFKPAGGDAPPLLLPVGAGLFGERAERFLALADAHALAEWLVFLAHLSRAQQRALDRLPRLPLPEAAALARAGAHGMPPLHAETMERPAAWRAVLRSIVAELAPQAGAATRAVLDRLAAAPDKELERLAADLLAGHPDRARAGELPFVGAALQVVWTALAAQLDARCLRPLDTPGVCPCCGSPPVASVLRLAPEVNNLRYLHCSLCNSEWNLPRALCSTCHSDHGVAYRQLDGGRVASPGSMRAETCDDCQSYLKIAWQEKDPRVDPVADDIATLALDLLVDEAGYRRSGPNLLLVGGAA